LAFVAQEHLLGTGLLLGEVGQQGVPAVGCGLGVEDVLVDVPGQGGVAVLVVMVERRQLATRRVRAITPTRSAIFSVVV
jgi:hypothetical protein